MKKPPDCDTDLWAAIDAANMKFTPPAGAITRSQYARRYGLTPGKAKTMLQRLVKSGVLEEIPSLGTRLPVHYVKAKRNGRRSK